MTPQQMMQLIVAQQAQTQPVVPAPRQVPAPMQNTVSPGFIPIRPVPQVEPSGGGLAPVTGGPRPGLPNPPFGQVPTQASPAFLPQNSSDAVNMGRLPEVLPPTPMSPLQGVDFGKVLAEFNKGAQVPELTPFTAPPEHKPLAFADPNIALNRVKEIGGPADPRLDKGKFEQQRFADAMAAAAMAASQGNDLGQVIGMAGGAFGASASGSNKERRAEDLQFAEMQRGWQMDMAQAEDQVRRAEADQANATSDLEFTQAQDAWQVANQNILRQEQRGQEIRSMALQRSQLLFDITKGSAEAANANAQIDWNNKEAVRQHANDMAARITPHAVLSSDGKNVIRSYMNDKGDMIMSTEPFGMTEQVRQMAEKADLLPESQREDFLKQGIYANMARMSPEHARRQAIMDIVSYPGAESIFDPSNTPVAMGFDKMGPYFQDLFTTSQYENAVGAARSFADLTGQAQGLDPAATQKLFLEQAAANLDRMFTPDVIKRAGKIGDKNVQRAVQYLQLNGGK